MVIVVCSNSKQAKMYVESGVNYINTERKGNNSNMNMNSNNKWRKSLNDNNNSNNK